VLVQDLDDRPHGLRGVVPVQHVDLDRVGAEDIEALEQVGGDVGRRDAPPALVLVGALGEHGHVVAPAAAAQPPAEHALALAVLAAAVEHVAPELDPGVEQLRRDLPLRGAVERGTEHEHGEVAVERREAPVPQRGPPRNRSLVRGNSFRLR
jgi:hypothetical protein